MVNKYTTFRIRNLFSRTELIGEEATSYIKEAKKVVEEETER